MSRYKINIDKKEPSKEEIKKSMDFNKLMYDYKKLYRLDYILKNIYRDRKLLRIIIFISILLLSIWLIMMDPKHESNADKNPNDKKTESPEHQKPK